MSAAVKQRGIVVAVDGSPASNAATCWAARDAAMRNIPLTVVHAVVTPTATWPPVPYPESLAVRLEDEGKKAVMHAIKIAEDATPTDRKVTIKRELVYSTPALALIKMSDEAEMIVVGTSGRGLLARGVLGSVSATVVRQASCPVAVIRDEDLPDPHAPVLVGIDGSPASELAKEVAFDEASRRGVDLMALHAWSDVTTSELPELDWSAVEPEAQSSLAESPGGLARTLSRRDGAPSGRTRSAGATTRRKVKICAACRRGQSRPRWFNRHAAGLGQQRSPAPRPDTCGRRPAVVSV